MSDASLHSAIKANDLNTVKRMLAQGSNVNAVDSSKRTALHMASWIGNAEIVTILLRQKADFNARAMDGFTAAHFAAQNNHADCIRALGNKNKGVLNTRTTRGGKTPLHIAVSKKNVESIIALIELGADTQSKNAEGKSALDLADDELRELIVETMQKRREARGKTEADESTIEVKKSQDDVTESIDASIVTTGKSSTKADDSERPTKKAKVSLSYDDE